MTVVSQVVIEVRKNCSHIHEGVNTWSLLLSLMALTSYLFFGFFWIKWAVIVVIRLPKISFLFDKEAYLFYVFSFPAIFCESCSAVMQGNETMWLLLTMATNMTGLNFSWSLYPWYVYPEF